IDVKKLPEGRIWETKQSYFLRDLFIDKIFHEKGLVTHATNTRQVVRRWKLALFGVGSLALLTWLVLTAKAKKAYDDSIGAQSADWAAAAKGWLDAPRPWNTNYQIWKPIIQPGTLQWLAEDRTLTLPGSVNLVEFHTRLVEHARKPLETN